uniref:Ion transport domain-containing protein n=2 Tax=Cafeteria roenbergensis TaxID=33653 RepID=A0A7S0P8M7_CAFRO
MGGFPRGALPGEAGTSTVMALGRSFVLRGPTGAAAEESGATAGSRQAGMHSVEIMPEYLDVLPVDWFWTRVWALTRPERLLDALFLLPVVVWLASGLSPRVIGACVTGLNFWRVLRAARVAKVLRYYGGFRLLLEAFSRKFDALATSWLLCACGAVLLAGLIFVAEFGKDSEFDEMGSAVWWSVITLTTVGYGDKLPVQAAGKLVATVAAIVGIALFTLPSSALAAGFSEYMLERNDAAALAVQKLVDVVRRQKLRRPFKLLRAKADRVLLELIRRKEGDYPRYLKRKAAVRKLFGHCAGEQGEVFMVLAQAKKVEKRLRYVAQAHLTRHIAAGPGSGIPPLNLSAGAGTAAAWPEEATLTALQRFISNPAVVLARTHSSLTRADSISSLGLSATRGGGASGPSSSLGVPSPVQADRLPRTVAGPSSSSGRPPPPPARAASDRPAAPPRAAGFMRMPAALDEVADVLVSSPDGRPDRPASIHATASARDRSVRDLVRAASDVWSVPSPEAVVDAVTSSDSDWTDDDGRRSHDGDAGSPPAPGSDDSDRLE